MSAVIVSGVFEDSWPAISSVVLMLVKTMALVVTFRVESLLNTGLKPISIACVAAAEYTGLTARPPSTPDQGAIFLIVTVVAMAFQHEVIKSASSKFCTLIFPCACTCSPVKRLRAQKFDAAFASADQSRGVHCLLQITHSLRPLECFCKNGGCSKDN